ncbi:MAG TPA: hypothetical protein VK104_04565, partial [Burkholderiaceae bacterium]|nr:hypothetical protein [Burkholderiaceae bacterium]
MRLSRSMIKFCRSGLAALALTSLVGCVATVPPNAFVVTDEIMKQRQQQSRKFDSVTETSVLVSGADVLQDLGYNLENSETALG